MEKLSKNTLRALSLGLGMLSAGQINAQATNNMYVGKFVEDVVRSSGQLVEKELNYSCPEKGSEFIFAYNTKNNTMLCVKPDGSFDFTNNTELQQKLESMAQLIKEVTGTDRVEFKITSRNNLGAKHITDPEIYAPLVRELLGLLNKGNRATFNKVVEVMTNKVVVSVSYKDKNTTSIMIYPDGQTPALTYYPEQLK